MLANQPTWEQKAFESSSGDDSEEAYTRPEAVVDDEHSELADDSGIELD